MSVFRDGVEAITRLAAYYRPPKSGDPVLDRWRMRVAGAILLLFAALIGHMVVSQVLPWQGPVARASDAADLDAKLDTLLAQTESTYKIALAQEICKLHFLRLDTSGRLHEALTEQYEEKQDDYARLNSGRRYTLSECAPPKVASE